LRFFNFYLPEQTSKQVGMATFQQRNHVRGRFRWFRKPVLVSHNKVHKTAETKLKPVSVSLNRMRPYTKVLQANICRSKCGNPSNLLQIGGVTITRSGSVPIHRNRICWILKKYVVWDY